MLHIQNKTIKENLPHQSFKSDDFKMFISTLWYDIVDDYDYFLIGYFSSIENICGLNVF